MPAAHRAFLILLTLIGLTVSGLAGPAVAHSAATPTPAEGYYNWLDFDCPSGPCGGAYGDWEVDLQVISGGKAVFSHVGSKCNGHNVVWFNFSKKSGTRAIHNGTVSISKRFKVNHETYTVGAKLRWVTEKKAKGSVWAKGRHCTAPKKAFAVTVQS